MRQYALGNPLPVGQRVIVLGGGSVAFDCADISETLAPDQAITDYIGKDDRPLQLARFEACCKEESDRCLQWTLKWREWMISDSLK